MSILCAGVGSASTSSCTTKATLASFGTGATTNGCFEVDKSFTNFAVTNGTTTGTGGVSQSTSTVDIQGTNTFSAVGTPWTVSAIFTGDTAAEWTATGTNGPQTNGIIGGAGGGGFLVNSSAAFIPTSTNTQYPTPDSGFSFFITTASLADFVATTGQNGNDSVSVTETFCVGTSACTGTGAGGNSIVLTATVTGNANNQSSAVYTCTAGTGAGITGCTAGSQASPITITFVNHVTTVNVSDQFVIGANANSSTTSVLTSFDNVFGEAELTPEPSTFLLLGAGLGGLGLLRLRRRRA